MSIQVIKTNDISCLDKVKIVFKDLRKSSYTKKTFLYDIYNSFNKCREPFIIQTPTLSTSSNLIQFNNHYSIFLSLKNLEFDKEIQNFYLFFTNMQNIIIKKLSELYKLSDHFIQNNELSYTPENKKYNLFINSEKYVSFCVQVKKDLTICYNRFKVPYTIDKVFCDDSILKKNIRCQFILELPSIWFELNSNDEIHQIGFNWSALQIKIIEQTAILECLIEEEVIISKKIGLPPPPPPPPPPPNFFKIGGFKRENIEKSTPKKPFKPKETNGFKPPTLDDILLKLKSLKKAENVTEN